MSNIGKLFKIKGTRPPRPPKRDYDENRSSSDCSEDDESYSDPATVHPTLSPNESPVMPSYPPPRPNHSPANRRVHDAGKRASVPVTFGQSIKPTRSQRPQSAELLQQGKMPAPGPRFGSKMPDDYSDPWDAKKAMSPGGDYSDPWDATNTQPGALTDPTKAGRKTSKDDYIDPWDAKEDGKTQVERVTVEKVKHQSNEDSDEESYSEPYDLGKVTLLDEQAKRMSLRGMRPSSVDGTFSEQEENRFRKHSDTVAKKQQSPSRDQRSADDYDSPWESKSFLGMQQKSPNLPQERPQAPVTDTRSSDDYDKPWEWNKNINLNGHTQGPRQQEPVQSPKIDARHPDDYDAPWEWSKSGLTSKVKGPREGEAQGMALVAPSKPPRTFVEDGSPIDPSLPLARQGWYHGPLKRLEAERLLQSAEDCSFLLRQSESSKNDFSLSVKNNNSFMHLKIVCQGNRYILGQFSKPFNTVPEMIHYYSLNKLNIRGAEHKKLLHPVVPPPEYFTLEPGGYPTAS